MAKGPGLAGKASGLLTNEQGAEPRATLQAITAVNRQGRGLLVMCMEARSRLD